MLNDNDKTSRPETDGWFCVYETLEPCALYAYLFMLNRECASLNSRCERRYRPLSGDAARHVSTLSTIH